MKIFSNLQPLKKHLNQAVALTATVSALTCLIPEVAEARPRLRFSGTSFNATEIDFDIDILVNDEDESVDTGRFPGAIRNFSYQLSGSGPQAQFDFGDIITSLDGPGGTVKYDFVFGPDTVVVRNDFDRPELGDIEPSDFRLSLLISSTSTDLVNSLSDNLPTPIDVDYIGPFSDGSISNTGSFTLISNSECIIDNELSNKCSFNEVDVPDSTEDVPEPATTLSLLGLAGLGTVRSLLKRKKS